MINGQNWFKSFPYQKNFQNDGWEVGCCECACQWRTLTYSETPNSVQLKSFKERNLNVEISFSKFAECRPKQCVLSGLEGAHSVCVCTTHQNMDLMFQHAKILSTQKNETYILKFHKTEKLFYSVTHPVFTVSWVSLINVVLLNNYSFSLSRPFTRILQMKYLTRNGHPLTEPTWKMQSKRQKNF